MIAIQFLNSVAFIELIEANWTGLSFHSHIVLELRDFTDLLLRESPAHITAHLFL